MVRRTRQRLLAGLAALLLLASAPAAAAEEVGARLARLEALIEAQAQALQAQSARLAAQDRRLELQERVIRSLIETPEGAGQQTLLDPLGRVRQPRPALAAAAAPARPQAQPPAQAPAPQPQPQPRPAQAPAAAPEPERPQSERAVEQLLVDVGGVLLPKGTLQLEPSLDFTHVSSDRVNIAGFTIFNAIVIGTIRVDDLDRDIATGSATARLGLPSFCVRAGKTCLWPRRTQLELRGSGVYRQDRELRSVGTADAEDLLVEGFGIGDSEATLSWQPILANGARPAVVLRARGRFPTGESAFQIPQIPVSEEDGAGLRLARAPTGGGFFGWGPGATAVWQYDPVIFFAGGGYSFNLPRSFAGFGRIDPGDILDGSAGLNIVLNDRVSFNASYVYQRTFRSEQAGMELLGTRATDSRLVFGSSIALSNRVTLVLNAQAGLTDESPDFAFSVALPFTFRGLFR